MRRRDLRYVCGQELVRTYDAPILREPPAYRSIFCSRCGSPVPDPDDTSEWFEIAAGALEGDLGQRPERHIMVHVKASWFEITDGLPQLDLAQLEAWRKRAAAD